MKRRAVGLLLLGAATLAIAVSSSLWFRPTGAHPHLEISTLTPSGFSYLPLTVKDWPPATPELADLWLVNNSGREICDVYFSPPTDPWGKNRLVGGRTYFPVSRTFGGFPLAYTTCGQGIAASPPSVCYGSNGYTATTIGWSPWPPSRHLLPRRQTLTDPR